MGFKGLIKELLNPTREHNNFKIIKDKVVLVVEEVVHGMVVLNHNVSCVENLDTLSKNVTIVLTQISLGSQMIQSLQTTTLVKTRPMTTMLTTPELLNDDN